jgi:hypothetical protein
MTRYIETIKELTEAIIEETKLLEKMSKESDDEESDDNPVGDGTGPHGKGKGPGKGKGDGSGLPKTDKEDDNSEENDEEEMDESEKFINALIAKEVIAEGDKEEYQKFFKEKLDKYDVKSPAELSDEDKKKFFNEIEKEWTKDD